MTSNCKNKQWIQDPSNIQIVFPLSAWTLYDHVYMNIELYTTCYDTVIDHCCICLHFLDS